MTLTQIADHWWQKNQRRQNDARRRLSTLIRANFLIRRQVIAAPLPDMDKPVVRWSPQMPEPNAGAVAWQLKSRWTKPSRMVSAYLATGKATQIFGGQARGYLKQEYQATHDLGVSQMYLHYRTHLPELADAWIGEDTLAPFRRRQKLPDAVIAEAPSARPVVVLEFGGSYDKRRVEAFHLDCQQRGVPYEIW